MRSIANLSVLIVEDEPLQRVFLAEKLKELGCADILQAQDGVDAMSLLKECPIDLIFCDIGMPNMDGSQFVLAQDALQAPRDLPMLIWMSAHDGDIIESHLQMARSAGFPFVDAIAKPISLPALSIVTDAALALHNAIDVAQQRTTARHSEDAIDDDDILRAICDTSEFEVWYQPHLSLTSKMLVGADTQVRWNHPKFSYLSAAEFMSLIEKQGLGLMLFYRTINYVLKTQQKLEKIGCRIPLYVKTSAATLETPEIADYLYERVQQHHVLPSLITIGMSEEDPPQQALKLAASLNRLRLRGFGLSIDDFGSGISTMKLLSQMPFTEIRIDSHFVRQFLRQRQCRVIVESIIHIARQLQLKITAEGIENTQQMEALVAMGCMQGLGDIASPMKQEALLHGAESVQFFSSNIVNV